MGTDNGQTLHDVQLKALERRLCQALIDGDRQALSLLLSPAMFMMDGDGGRLFDLPWLDDWLGGHLQVRALHLQAVDTLLCGRLALLSSPVQMVVVRHGQEQALRVRLLRVWACSSGGEGAQLVSMTVLAA